MATQQNKLLIDTGVMNDLSGSGYCLVEYTNRHVLVTSSDMKPFQITIWKIEELETLLNADYIDIDNGLALLRWR